MLTQLHQIQLDGRTNALFELHFTGDAGKFDLRKAQFKNNF
jgi:hypothetical protein